MSAAANRCRIGRIKLKTGAEIRVLDTPREGNPDVMEMLIRLLDKARRGELVAFGMVTVNGKGTVGTAWTYGEGGHHYELASGALTLATRLGES